jgi:hypothetical protein
MRLKRKEGIEELDVFGDKDEVNKREVSECEG